MRVAVPVPVKTLLDYAVPSHLELKNLTGFRVRVLVGRRQLVGVVVGNTVTDPKELRPLLEIIDQEPVINNRLIYVLLEHAAHIACPP